MLPWRSAAHIPLCHRSHSATGAMLEDNPYVLELRRSPSLPTVIAFSSVNTPKGRFKPFEFIRNANVNVVFANDSRNAWYQEGISGVSPEVEVAAHSLVEHARRIGNGRVVTFGTSMGAYGALLYASLGGADGALAFGPECEISMPWSRSAHHLHPQVRTKYGSLLGHVGPSAVVVATETDEVDLVAVNRLSAHGAQAITVVGMEHPGVQVFTLDGSASHLIEDFAETLAPPSVGHRRGTLEHELEYVEQLYQAYVLKKERSAGLIGALFALLRVREHPTVYLRLGEEYRRLGRNQEARDAWKRCVELSEFQYEAHAKLAALPATPRDEAFAHLESSLNINPWHAHAHHTLGKLRERSGEQEKALAHYRRAVQLNHGNPGFRGALERLSQQLHRQSS